MRLAVHCSCSQPRCRRFYKRSRSRRRYRGWPDTRVWHRYAPISCRCFGNLRCYTPFHWLATPANRRYEHPMQQLSHCVSQRLWHSTIAQPSAQRRGTGRRRLGRWHLHQSWRQRIRNLVVSSSESLHWSSERLPTRCSRKSRRYLLHLQQYYPCTHRHSPRYGY